MQASGNNTNWQQARLTIRVSNQSLSFSVVDREAEHQVIFESYTMKSGVSLAANLRQAFKESDLLMRGYNKVRVFLDAPVLVVPIEEFHEEDAQTLYQHAFTGHDADAILYRVQPTLNVVAIFPINKDLKLVVEDNFKDVRFTPLLQPVWNYLHQRSFTGMYRKLYVWKQLGLNHQQDELHLVGSIPDKDWLLYNSKLYIKKTFALNASAEFNRAPITEIPGMPFDLLTLYLSK